MVLIRDETLELYFRNEAKKITCVKIKWEILINKLRKNTNVPILFGVDFSTDHLCYGLNYAIYILIHVTPINIIFKITRIHKNTSMQLQISECAKTIIIIFVSSYFMFYNLIGAYFAHFQ